MPKDNSGHSVRKKNSPAAKNVSTGKDAIPLVVKKLAGWKYKTFTGACTHCVAVPARARSQVFDLDHIHVVTG